MNIAFEALSLSLERLTGVGNVALNYLVRLEKMDRRNTYYIYTIDGLRHFTPDGSRFIPVEYDHPVKRAKVRASAAWSREKERFTRTHSPAAFARMVALRLMKMWLELASRVVFPFWLASSLKKNRIDIYFGNFADFFPWLFFHRPARIWLIHDLVWKLFPETMELKRRFSRNVFIPRAMRRADLLLTVSDNTGRDIQSVLGIGTPVQSLYNAADPAIFHPAKKGEITRVKGKYGLAAPYVLSVSTLEPRKNLETLLAAFRDMKKPAGCRLVLVGMKGWINEGFFRLIDEMGLAGEVVTPGYVPDGDLAPLYSGASVFAFPSIYEGFGLPVLEAMQCGCPVVVSSSSSIPEVAGDAGIIVDPMDAAGFAREMGRVMSDTVLAKRMSRAGLARAGYYSWDRSAKSLIEVFESFSKA